MYTHVHFVLAHILVLKKIQNNLSVLRFYLGNIDFKSRGEIRMCFRKVRRRFSREQLKCTLSDWLFSSLLLVSVFFCEAQAELWNYNNRYLNFWIIKNKHKINKMTQVKYVLDIPHFHDWFLEVSVKRNMPKYLHQPVGCRHIPPGYLRFQGWYNFHTKNPREQSGTRWWFRSYVLCSPRNWGNDPIWRAICFKWVETTN